MPLMIDVQEAKREDGMVRDGRCSILQRIALHLDA
jgi:hypothetical protein